MVIVNWKLRPKGDKLNPYVKYKNNPNLFSLKVNHRGGFSYVYGPKRTSSRRVYKDGNADWFDDVDVDGFSVIEVSRMLKELDIDVLDLLSYVHKFKLIELFIEHHVDTCVLDTSVIDLDHEDNSVSDGLESGNAGLGTHKSDGLESVNAGLGTHESKVLESGNAGLRTQESESIENDNVEELDLLFSYPNTNHQMGQSSEPITSPHGNVQGSDDNEESDDTYNTPCFQVILRFQSFHFPSIYRILTLAMSSDNASSAVTYTSISSDSNGPSWGIPLVNAGELLEMDPYEEVAQQGQTPPLSPAYVPDPTELDEHVPIYVPEPEHPEYHGTINERHSVETNQMLICFNTTAELLGHIADSESMEEDSIDYPDEPEDDDEDPKENPEEDHTDYPADGEDGREEEEHLAPANSSVVLVVDPIPSARDIKAFKTDESAPTPRSPQTRVLFSQTRLRRARKTVRLEPPTSASIEARIAEHAAAPIPPTSPAYDQAPLGHRAAMIRMRDDIPEEDMLPRRRFVLTAPLPGCDVAESSAAAAARTPRGQYDFVDTVEAGQGLIRSPSKDARTIARTADRVKDVGYVRALQAPEHRMMTSIEEVNLRVSY
ncbi:hypothetical protein Tco_0726726 [Tanacetum coccineum]|uniref:Uncharacterized protein n=1 Tax=Tanacetum coccineum TaxID=301880 RepID=A0ABQ4YH10_9ASTR